MPPAVRTHRPRRTAVSTALVLVVLGLSAPQVSARPDEVAQVSAQHHALAVAPAITEAIATTGSAPVLVALADGVPHTAPLDELARAAATAQAAVLADLAPGDFAMSHRYSHLPMLAGRVTEAGLARLRAHPRVRAIDEDVWLRPLAPPAAPAAAPPALAESVPSVGADLVHSRYGITGEGVAVAVLDTGIDNDHADFEGAIVDQQCFSANSKSCVSASGRGTARSDNAEDEQGHGTLVSGIILGRGRVAPTGMAPEAKLVAVRVFRDQGGAPTGDIVDGLNWVLQRQHIHNIRVVNMSLGGGAALGNQCDDQYAGVKDMFQRLVARGVTIFVATGNGGNSDRVAFPACISNSIAVGSTWDARLRMERPDCHGKTEVGPMDITCYTDRGRAMDLVAPGSVIVSSQMGGGKNGDGPTAGGHGTSFASPSAAGVAALLLQADPELDPRDVERILLATGDTVIHPESGAEVPRVNALRAVESVLPATPTPPATDTPLPPTVTPTPEASPTDLPTTAPPTASPTATLVPTPQPGPAIFLPLLGRRHSMP